MGKRGIDGQSPIDVAKLQGESGIEVINNGLGSGVLVDEDGNYTADDNKQQGSVAINMDGLGACVADDLCILDCEFSANEIEATDLLLSEMSGYVSHSPAANLAFNVVKKADGTALAGATIVVKEKNSSGTVVSAETDGSYNLEPNGTYYYSVSKDSYTAVTGTLKKVKAGNNILIVEMAAA